MLAGYALGLGDMTACLVGDRLRQHLWQWALYNVWIVVAIAYCMAVVVLVILKLTRNERSLTRALTVGTKPEAWQTTRYNTVIKALVRRV